MVVWSRGDPRIAGPPPAILAGLGYLGGVLPHAQLFLCPGQACCYGQPEKKKKKEILQKKKGNFDKYRSPLQALEVGDNCCQGKI